MEKKHFYQVLESLKHSVEACLRITPPHIELHFRDLERAADKLCDSYEEKWGDLENEVEDLEDKIDEHKEEIKELKKKLAGK